MVSALLQALLTANKELNRSASGELCNPYQASKSTKFGAYTHSQLPATSLYFNVIAQSKPLSCYAQMLHIASRSGTSLLSLPFSPAWHIWFSHWKLPHQADFSSSSLISAPAAVATSGLLWAPVAPAQFGDRPSKHQLCPEPPKVGPPTKVNRSVPLDWALTPQQVLF